MACLKDIHNYKKHERQVIEKIIQQLPNQMLTFRDNEYVHTCYFTPTDHEKIEQNQKIVNALKLYHADIEKCPLFLPSKDDDTVEEIKNLAKFTVILIEKIIKEATGKDICELS